MLRAVLICSIVVGALCAAEFDGCVKRHLRSTVTEQSWFAIAVTDDRLLVPVGFLSVQNLPKEWELDRFDPLTGFALVKVSHNLLPIVWREADRLDEHRDLLLFHPNESAVVPSAGVKRQFALSVANAGKSSLSGTLLSAPCYSVVGISMMGGIVESDYLRHFIFSDQDDFGWGDLGVRLEETAVKYIDPFVANNPFEIGDKIAAINSQSYDNPRELERAILFLQPDTNATIAFDRNESRLEVVVAVGRRLGGFLAADTFLEHFGWLFDRSLFVRDAGVQVRYNTMIRAGDQLVGINGVLVNSQAEAMAELSVAQGRVRVLIQRDSFQFFVHLESARQ
ncbi:PDZ domain-containing protein [Campylobacterota bacterium]|nr:PDZ domain-containing protein [Campylobacterota bacterium]